MFNKCHKENLLKTENQNYLGNLKLKAKVSINFQFVNPFHATGFCLYSSKPSVKTMFFDTFKACRKKLVARNG